ncbi:hypothetical protein ACOMHN_060951 [Nucella lapillus]
MGIYLSIIGVADGVYRGRYVFSDGVWKTSVYCQVAGFLSLLSSEVSAMVIWLISLDRFIVIRFPFSSVRFDRTSATVGLLLALMPLLPATSHWEFYSQTGI